jgi:hypothetical protein
VVKNLQPGYGRIEKDFKKEEIWDETRPPDETKKVKKTELKSQDE